MEEYLSKYQITENQIFTVHYKVNGRREHKDTVFMFTQKAGIISYTDIHLSLFESLWFKANNTNVTKSTEVTRRLIDGVYIPKLVPKKYKAGDLYWAPEISVHQPKQPILKPTVNIWNGSLLDELLYQNYLCYDTEERCSIYLDLDSQVLSNNTPNFHTHN